MGRYSQPLGSTMMNSRNASPLSRSQRQPGARDFCVAMTPMRLTWVTLVCSISMALLTNGTVASPMACAQQQLDSSQTATAVEREGQGTKANHDSQPSRVGPHLKHIFYWTTCEIVKEAEEPLRVEATLAQVSVGELTVSIPESHQAGAYERPLFGGRINPQRHLSIEEISPSANDDWLIALKASLAAAARQEILVIVHGFNMSFQDAAIRAAQWWHDSGYPGVVIMFAWPSQGVFNLDNYHLDQANATASVPALIQLLEALALHFPETPRHALAHSLGCRITMASAISMESRAQPELKPINRLILAAPDIDDAVFRRVGLPALTCVASDITVLCNPADLALKISSEQHGNRPRTGLVKGQYVEFTSVRTINVGGLSSLFGRFGMGHMYFTDCPVVMGEICRRLEGIEGATDLLTGVEQQGAAVNEGIGK